jgi:hypothetical protein
MTDNPSLLYSITTSPYSIISITNGNVSLVTTNEFTVLFDKLILSIMDIYKKISPNLLFFHIGSIILKIILYILSKLNI